MNSDDERIPVPTNGQRPPVTPPEATPPEATPPEATPPAVASALGLAVAFTPGQIAAGFGIIAALIVFIAGRRRGKRG